MFFKNLKLYRLTQDLPFDPQVLELALAAKPARPCASQELTTYGFVAPFGKGDNAPLVHVSGDFLLVSARKEERILPGSVVRDALKEKVDAIEADQQRKVYKKERDQLKDDIVQAFLPRAFVRQSSTYAAIAPKLGLIIVNSYSAKTAEDLLSTLREVIGTLPVRPVTSKIAPTVSLTDWMKTQQAPAGFTVLDECELRDTHESGGTVRCKRQDLTADEFQMHLNGGKVVTQLSLAYEDKLTFVLDGDLNIRRVRFSDLLEDQAQQDGGDDALGQLDASFMLMMLTLAEFIPQLMTALGGEEQPQGLGEGQPARAHAPESADGDDDLLPEAMDFVISSRRASVSAVQRKFKIGYNRAARLIEALELKGIVTPMNSRGAREVVGQG